MSSLILKICGIAIIVVWYFLFKSESELTRNLIFVAGILIYMSGSIVRFIQQKSKSKVDELDS
tara:strand:+ start:4250 stop:4438 length:189 start_codon:yes stop_codon:yes gene_type:complete